MARAAFIIVAALLLFARFSQVDVLWVEEAYPTAAAAQILDGKFLYRDIWFDKPPLYALVYLLWDALPGFALRWAGALFVGLAAAVTFRFANDMWGRREGVIAGSLLALYLSFGIPSAVMALAPDLLTVLPHIAAVFLAWKRKAFWSGFAAAIAFLTNTKAAFVVIVALVWVWPLWRSFLVGFVLPNLFFLAVLIANGALRDYWEQVWVWGWLYSRDTFLAHPLSEGIRRTLNWTGFHIAAIIGAALFLWRERDWRWLVWIVLAAASIPAGLRFFPRYYFAVLPAVVVMAGRGIALMPRWGAVATLALVLLPIVRFAPRDVKLWRGHLSWSDLAMNQDSKAAAALLKQQAPNGATLLVWGYRPDIFVYSGLPAGTRYLDSQPLTGVMADRHLGDSHSSAPEIAARNLAQLPRTPATFIADGLGPYNPALAVTRFLDMSGYQVYGRTAGTVIYGPTRAPTSAAVSRGMPKSPPARPE